MWRSSKPFLMVTSVALNLAFVAVWFTHAISAGMSEETVSDPAATTERIWCPLHAKLDVSDEQWGRIEPRLKAFRDSARSLCQRMSTLRLEIMELLAAPTPDLEAIAARQEKIQAGQRKMQKLVIGHLLAEKEILTQKQEERLFNMIREQSGCSRNGPRMMSGRGRTMSGGGGVGRMFRDEVPSN